MRSLTILALALVSATALAGCSGDDDGGDGPTTTTSPAATTTSPGPTTTTPPAPNDPPVLAIKVTDEGGNVTKTTLVDGSLTFDASASADPDGQITDLAIIVADANQTRSAQLLRNGQFTPATFLFDRAGVVQITLNALDDRGASASLQDQAYINEVQVLDGRQLTAAAPPTYDPTSCAGPTGNGVIDPTMWINPSIDVKAGATYIEVTIEALIEGADQDGDATLAICDPDGAAISAAGAPGEIVMTDADVEFTASLQYYVSAAALTPRTTLSGQAVVHYDPLPG